MDAKKKASKLEDKVMILTGASSGIGWATALELAPYRPRLILVARRDDKLKELARRIKDSAAEVRAYKCDVSDLRQGKQLIAEVLKRWGRIDILINNAGIMATRRFEKQSMAEVESVMRTNYLGAVNLVREALPAMLTQGRGHIINVASMAGMMGLPYMASYCASKFALVGFTEALRREYYGTGVTFTAYCPGSVDTPMTSETLKDVRLRKLTRAKTAGQAAKKLISCALKPRPELIYGEAPGFLLKLLRLAPGATDWLTHQVYKRVHPMAREIRKK